MSGIDPVGLHDSINSYTINLYFVVQHLESLTNMLANDIGIIALVYSLIQKLFQNSEIRPSHETKYDF